MSKYRNNLPQLDGKLFITDGGLETTLVFREGVDLPYFAAFHLLRTKAGRSLIKHSLSEYARVAREHGSGLILETPTWRASPDWGKLLEYSEQELRDTLKESVLLLKEIRNEHQSDSTPIVISGNLGPRADGYVVESTMSIQEAKDYHFFQVETFAKTDADMICAMTINYAEEAIGIINAARENSMPVAVSFTVETDGSLPGGMSLKRTIEHVDDVTGSYASYYMLNCAHPDHFRHILEPGSRWMSRLRGIRANASRKSHSELNESTELDPGDPLELGITYQSIQSKYPAITILGGCCGTDPSHISQIARQCMGLRSEAR